MKKRQLLIIVLFLYCVTIVAQYKNVKPGDVITIGSVKAIVYETNGDGTHGKCMTIRALRGIDDMWCNDKKLVQDLPLTLSLDDGEENTKTIIDFAKEKGALNNFPVFEWCEKLGEGWYVPSTKELEKFVNWWLGNEVILDWDSEEEDNEQALDGGNPTWKEINKVMLEAGGTPFLSGVFTSTVDENGRVSVFIYNKYKNTWRFAHRTKADLKKWYVGRAFHKF